MHICKYSSNLILTGLNDMHSSQKFMKLLGIMKNGITDSINSTLLKPASESIRFHKTLVPS